MKQLMGQVGGSSPFSLFKNEKNVDLCMILWHCSPVRVAVSTEEAERANHLSD
jgi:hypothetical protein